LQSAATDPAAPLGVACFANQFGDAQGHGLARYARELAEALRQIDDLRIVPVAGWSSLAPEALAERHGDIGLETTGLGRRGTSLLWTFLDRPTLESRISVPVDVVHAVSLGYPVATRKPFVVTIHDLGPLTQPHFFRNTRPWVMQRSLKQVVRKADAIVCVSQSTADEVRDYVGPAVDGRLRVVLEGVSEAFFDAPDPALLASLDLPAQGTPFILSAGAISPRKNVEGLLRAMIRLAREIPHHLVLVGGAGWDGGPIEAALADRALRGRVHSVGYVSDDQLRALYHAAELYVHPSLYEGFGLPVLEAMASGTPVLASDSTSLPEVVGQAGRLTDASDPDALARAIAEICGSPEGRAAMADRGRAHAATFRWSARARQMRDVYHDVAAS